MRIAIIENEICTNVIECESVELASELTNKTCVEAAEGYGIGDMFDGETWTKKEPIEPEEPEEQGSDYDEMAEAIREGVNSI